MNRICHYKIIPVLTFLKALIAVKQRYKNEIKGLLLEKSCYKATLKIIYLEKGKST